MLKSTALAALGLLTLSGAAYAGDYHRNLAFQSTGPQPIMDIVEAGGGTVAGTVGTVSEMWFVLNDGEMEIPVTGDGFLPEGISSGDQSTVIGGIWQGAIQADQIIRQDGTAFGRVIAAASLRDNVWLEGSGGLFTGSAPDILGQLTRRDFVYARLKIFL